MTSRQEENIQSRQLAWQQLLNQWQQMMQRSGEQYNLGLKDINQLGERGILDIKDREKRGMADIGQSLAQRGLGSTTMLQSAQMGERAQTNKSLSRQREMMASVRSQYRMGGARMMQDWFRQRAQMAQPYDPFLHKNQQSAGVFDWLNLGVSAASAASGFSGGGGGGGGPAGGPAGP